MLGLAMVDLSEKDLCLDIFTHINKSYGANISHSLIITVHRPSPIRQKKKRKEKIMNDENSRDFFPINS